MRDSEILVNVRSASVHLTGVQRYILEILERIGPELATVKPDRPMVGIPGHLWDQAALPLHVHGRLLWSPANLGPLAVARQVVTVHDICPIDHPEWFAGKFKAWFTWVLPRLARRCAGIITVSDFSRRRIIDAFGVPEDKVRTIFNGIPDRFRQLPPAEIDRLLGPLALPSRRYVLSVGSLEPRKNVPRLLKAWKELLPRLDPDIWLVLAGAKGVSRLFVETEAVEIPERVHFTGHLADEALPALYSGALCFAYISEYEGFGLPVVEAMRCGAATVTGNRTALPEVAGGAALLVDTRDIAGIGSAIERLCTDATLRADLSERGIRQSARFTWTGAADETLAYLREVAAQSRR